ncbi:MAG: hypothetical protein AAGI48_05030 [Verrucomicrobiota bacterium]
MEQDPEKKLRVLEEEDTEEVLRLGGLKKKPEVVEKVVVPRKPEEAARLESLVNLDDLDRRSIEPDIDTIIDGESEPVYDGEQEWAPKEDRPVPYGWFVLVFLFIAALVTTALIQIQRSADGEGEVARQVAVERLEEDERADAEAYALVEAVEEILRKYLTTSSHSELLPLVRDPERVRPLMEEWYARNPKKSREFDGLGVFQPLDINGRLFWLATCMVKDAEHETVLIEQTQDGKVLIDWESQVCYQPMAWERYVEKRPAGGELDFRIYLQPDLQGFYSHEFSDEEKWNVYRLTAKDSEEYLFGYVLRGSELDELLLRLVRENQGYPASLYLRLGIPEGTTSPRGVLIKELLSERWALVDPVTGD